MNVTHSSSSNEYDLIIIGAGISGINSAYRIQEQLPSTTYAILEGRTGPGGTWDLFRYPGIRSDSDLYTFGFPWAPWTKPNPIADGASIREYLKDSAAAHGIDRHFHFQHKVISMNWLSDEQTWRLEVDVNGEKKYFYGRFVILGTGYYNYQQPLPAVIPGLENFKGTVVHPQFWPEDLDYTDKKMVVIGSGATAITLLPSLAEKASRVTMLQRSPSYVMSVPQESDTWAHRWLPSWLLLKLTRIQFLIISYMFFNFCRTFPNAAKWVLRSATVKQLPANIPHDPHFKPTYNPWEQRLCFCPDGDFFKCFHNGKADVATGHVKTVTEDGILLESGQKLDADIIVTATGLNIQIAGGIEISVDGSPIHFPDKFLWRFSMLQDVPNCGVIIGYTNSSWTLAADATAVLLGRLMNYMKTNKITSAVPRLEHPEQMKSAPALNLNSTYIKAARDKLPKTGDSGPWLTRQNYFKDYWNGRYANITTGLEFSRVST
ncbi:monooxygenase flavin-binding family protein-like protein [Lepidopterella palustris CBS 459.81]|uniref:Monooxygenase flavin-binding family protein-like protein n=1 Tax=Lepidopterella palustris CBS 459.81 TaxID=1314670 RepID=A0A8E2JK32_9PEZI|nr:monooxygenase flavin-binding family protein-like protein [Lepidopterella palustris CBS 459.81]